MEGEEQDIPIGRFILQLALFVPVLFFNLVPDFKYAPLGRAAPLSVCALLVVLTGIIDEKNAFQNAIDHGTLVFLIGMMVLAAYLEKKRMLETLAGILFNGRSPTTLLILTSILSGVFAAVITNDGVCMLITPIVVKVCLERRLDVFPFLVAICTSSNIGSGATLSGNPQNILIAHLSKVYLYEKIGWLEFLALCLPAAILGLTLNIGLLLLFYRKDINAEEKQPLLSTDKDITFATEDEPATTRESISRYIQIGVTSVVVATFMVCFALGLSVELVTMIGSLLLVVMDTTLGKDPSAAKKLMGAVQWEVIIIFGSLFIVVEAFNMTQLPHHLWELCYPVMKLAYVGPAFFSFVLILLSTLVSNVPVVLMVAPEMKSKLAWIILSFAITVGGNFTLISSAANIIVDEKANTMNPNLRLEAWKYFKFGCISTIIVTGVGIYSIIGMGVMLGYEVEL